VTTDLDPTIVTLLDVHVPEQDGAGADWGDVVRRAERPSRITRLRRLVARHPRSAIGIVVVATAMGCVGAVAHGRIYELFDGGRSAVGTELFRRLQSEYRWPNGPHVLAKQSRVVFAVRSPEDIRHDGPRYWSTDYGVVAPRSDGGICLAGAGAFACVGPATPRIYFVPVLPAAWSDAQNHVHVAPFVLWGVAPRGTASMHLVLPDGGRLPVPLSRIRLSTRVVFALHVPTRLMTDGHRPTELVAEDTSGATIATYKHLQYYLFPTSYNRKMKFPPAPPGVPKPAPAARPVPASGVLLTLHVAGHTHRYSLGGGCLTDASDVYSENCQLATSFTPFVLPIDDRGGVAWGELPPGATHVTFVFAHRTEPAIVYINQYLFPVTTAELRSANLPIAIVATDAHGKVVERRGLRRSIYPGYG
jgi:hypothetical protein